MMHIEDIQEYLYLEIERQLLASIGEVEIYSFLSYFGGKHYLADVIITLFGRHHCYVEPFFGAGHVFFRKKPSKLEIINDIDPRLICLYRVLQDTSMFQEFLRMFVNTPKARTIFQKCKEKLTTDQFRDEIEKNFCFFYTLTNAFSSLLRGSFSYSSRKNKARSYIRKYPRLIHAHHRLKNAIILNRDAVDVIREYDSPETLFYLDPPYVHSTRSGEKDYQYEMTDDDHIRLVEVILSSQGRFIVSGYDHPIYRKLEKHGYQKITIDIACHAYMPGQKKVGFTRSRRQEVIWYNTRATQTKSISLFLAPE